MQHSRLSFSDRAIGALPFAASGQHIVRDEDVPGFFLLVGTRSKTFMIQGDLWENGKRRTIRVKVGEVGKIATREARAKAKVLLGSIADGVDPRPKPEEPVASRSEWTRSDPEAGVGALSRRAYEAEGQKRRHDREL